MDTRYFDEEFTAQTITLTPPDKCKFSVIVLWPVKLMMHSGFDSSTIVYDQGLLTGMWQVISAVLFL